MSDTLYRLDPATDIIFCHEKIPDTNSYYLYGSMVQVRPSSATPAQIRECPTLLQLMAHRQKDPIPDLPPISANLRTRLLQLEPSEQQLVGTHIHMPHNAAIFTQDLINGKVHSGSDGASKILQASHSWVLQSSRTGDFMASHAPTYPLNQQLSSKRPEAAGHAAALIVTRELLKGSPTPINKTMRFHIDNTSVVKGATPTFEQGASSTLAPEWDLIDKIHQLKTSLPIKTETVWVKGHQPRHSRWATTHSHRKFVFRSTVKLPRRSPCYIPIYMPSMQAKNRFSPPYHRTGIYPHCRPSYYVSFGQNYPCHLSPLSA